MSHSHSVTEWIATLKTGDQQAAEKLWRRYIDRLLTLARGRLKSSVRLAADEEDVALSALDGFFRGVQQGRFPQLFDRDDLWRVLVTLVERKAVDHARREQAEKRGGGRVVAETDFSPRAECGEDPRFSLEHWQDHEPTPEMAAELAEELARLLNDLGDATLRQIALLKLEDYTNKEIAEKLGLGLRSVERKLWMIRESWQENSP